MKRIINIDTWKRKPHFTFFKDFDEPFFGVTLQVDCTNAYNYAKKQGISFFLFYLYQSLKAANHTEAFRMRIEGEQVVIYDQINASSTIPRADGTFGFSYIPYAPNFEQFYPGALAEKERVANAQDLQPYADNANVIHYSALPWLQFSAISHARNLKQADSIPKITFGKMHTEGLIRKMPMAVHVNHALADGYHVGQYAELFQSLMNEI